MKTFLVAAATLFLALTTSGSACAQGAPRLAAGQPLPPAELEAYVDGVVHDAMDREHIAGVTVAVVQNGQVVLKKGYGAASLAPLRRVSPDTTLFRLGSISETFTWITLMRQVEADKIRIDAPINLYLPEALQVKDQGYHPPVHVINLMDHSAGFEDRALGHLFERDPDRERSLALYLQKERPRRVHAPGEVSSYSNYGAALAGEAVSYVSGRPFETLVEEQITGPLGLAHTTFREPRPPRAGLAAPMSPALAQDISQGFWWTPSGFIKRPYELIGHAAPAGSASSTAGDMARYMAMLLNNGSLDGVTVFGPKSAQAFRTPIRRTPVGINGWAHGFFQLNLPGNVRGFGHDGATLSFRSSMVLAPSLNLGIFIATNTESGGALTERLPEGVIEQFYASRADGPRPGDPQLTTQRHRYVGHYLSTRRAYAGREAFVDRIISGVDVSITSEGRLVVRDFSGARDWVAEGDPASGRFVSATGADHMVFVMSGDRAVRIIPTDNARSYERTGFWNETSSMLACAILTGLAALMTLAGLAVRNRREFRETSIQRLASLIQSIQGGLWLLGLSLFAVWASGAGDHARVMYEWPGAALWISMGSVFVATLLTMVTAFILPSVWRGGRRVDSWTTGRKFAFSITVLIYIMFSVFLEIWGALSPWAA